MAVKANLIGMTSVEIEAAISELGESRYRARQIYAGVYRRLWRDWDQFTDLGKPLREKLRARFSIEYPVARQIFVSRDGTRRYLFDVGSGQSGQSGQSIEAVFIPEEKRDTLCVSTQVGCAMGCIFCATGRLPMQRNLSAGEIAGQVMALVSDRGVQAKRLNIVIMGMGEPLNNYENVMAALKLMTCGEGMSVSPRRITLSTAGIVPGIERLAREPVQPNLAISLNASSDAVRDRLMPVNLKWNIAALLDACRGFPLAERRRLTFEYVLIGGVNDAYDDARRLVGLLGNLRHKVNLIPLNADPALGFKPPAAERVEAFARTLADHHVASSVRRPRGEDIAAACGMLAARGEFH